MSTTQNYKIHESNYIQRNNEIGVAKFLNKKGCGQVQANGFPLNHIKLFITPKQTIRLSEGPFRGSTCTVFLPALSQYENCACDEDRSGLKMAD